MIRKSAVALLVISAAAAPLAAQVRTPPRKPPTTVKPQTPPKAKPGVTAKADGNGPARKWRPYRFGIFSSEVYVTNIEREKEDLVGSNGFVFGGVAGYQSAAVRPGFSAAYEIARHSYTRSEQFDRISQNLSMVLARRLTKNITAEAIGEAALKGSSEDRDVGDQYLFLPRLSYKLGGSHRLRTYGAYRIRRYETDPGRDAINRYVGTELRSDLGRSARVEAGYRYEKNSAVTPRAGYTRSVYHTGMTRTFGSDDELFAEVKYRSQRYHHRLVEVDDEDVLRVDRRLSPTIEWIHRFGAGFSMIANYNFEARTSNDPDKGYLDHVFAVTGRYDW